MERQRLPKFLACLGLSVLAFVFLLAIGCQRPQEPKPMEPIPTPVPTATAEAEKAKFQPLIEKIGIPTSYRLATEDERNYFLPRDGNPPYIEKTTLKIEGNQVLVPVYPKGTIIGDYAAINIRELYPGEYWLGREQEKERWIARSEAASLALSQDNRNKAREDLLWVQEAIKKQNLFSAEKKLDKNGDGIADYMEVLSQGVNSLLENPLLGVGK